MATFASDSLNWGPDASGCANNSAVSWTYRGVALRKYEFRRYESGATPIWTPLRFPGQYYDAETELHENWHRYYDPTVGRYLAPDPILSSPGEIVRATAAGVSMPAYAYAGNNPIAFTDPTGLLFNWLDSRGNLLSAMSFSEDLMAMFKGLEVVGVMATSTNAEVAAAVTALRDSTTYGVNVYVNAKIINANAFTAPVPSRKAQEQGPMGGSYIEIKPAPEITNAIGGSGYDANGNWGWVGIASNFYATFAHELGHAAYNMSRWGVGPHLRAASGDWAIRFHNAYVTDPRSQVDIPYRPGGMPTQWGPHW